MLSKGTQHAPFKPVLAFREANRHQVLNLSNLSPPNNCHTFPLRSLKEFRGLSESNILQYPLSHMISGTKL